MKLPKYKRNLRIEVRDDNKHEVYSYNTLVAKFKQGEPMTQMGWWSVTTQKHINYVARCYEIPTIIKDY